MGKVQPSAATASEKLQVMFDGTRRLQAFVHESFSPLVRGLIELTPFESAVAGTHFRIDAWLKSLSKMTGAEDVQAVSAGARAILEMLVDLTELSADRSNAERYHAFARVERYHEALLRVKFADSSAGLNPTLVDQARAYVESEPIVTEIQKLIDKYGWRNQETGGPRWPKTWSTRGSGIGQRCEALGGDLPGLYRRTYKQLSWFVHAGAAAISGLDVESLEMFCYLANSHAQEFTRMALEIVARECRLFDGTPSLQRDIENTKAWTGRALMRLAQSAHSNAATPGNTVSPGSP
jgi:Family of unknown function (DUF5677)